MKRNIIRVSYPYRTLSGTEERVLFRRLSRLERFLRSEEFQTLLERWWKWSDRQDWSK